MGISCVCVCFISLCNRCADISFPFGKPKVPPVTTKVKYRRRHFMPAPVHGARGEKRLQYRVYCDCGRSFVYKRHLQYHRKHECGQPQACQACYKTFKTFSYLKRHQKIMHPWLAVENAD